MRIEKTRWGIIGRVLMLPVLSVVPILSESTFAAPVETAPAPDSSNILYILADQYRYDCVGATGNNDIHTPNLDQLARDGTLFSRFYVTQPVCSPTRASIFTGLYPHSAGVSENNVALPKSSKTLAEMLTPQGYDCGYFGKWHLVRRDAFPTFPEYPNDGRGKGHYFGEAANRRYSVDVITEEAIQFLRRSRSKPFYLCVSYYPPHPPFSVPAQYVERYQNIPDKDMRVYYAMCTKVDEAIGRLLKALDEARLADNTLVMFNSEHGHNFNYRWNHHYKRLCYDTSARVPLIVRMPGVVPAGRLSDALLSSVDLVPTMLSLVRKPVPSGLQGRDFGALLRGETDQGREYAFMENVPFPFAPEKGEERCVLNGQWKLILSTKRAPELYEYKSDPQEIRNRWDEMKNRPVVAELLRQLQTWATETHDRLAPRLLKDLQETPA